MAVAHVNIAARGPTGALGPQGLTGLQGPQGSQGSQGVIGLTGLAGVDAGLRWRFDNGIDTTSDPGTGFLRLNNAAPASVTEIGISNLIAETGNPSASAWLATWDDSTNTALKGTVVLKKASAPENFAVYDVTAAVAAAQHWRMSATHRAGAGAFASTDMLSVQFFAAGNKGADGAGVGDFVGPADSAADEVVLFAGATGKAGQRPGTGTMLPPRGTTAQRPGSLAAGDEGRLRWNSETDRIEVWAGAEWRDLLSSAGGSTLTGGFTVTTFDHGTKTTGFTPEPSQGARQKAVVNAALAITAPTTTGVFTVTLTNGASMGALSFSGFAGPAPGSATFATTSGLVYECFIVNDGVKKTYQLTLMP